MIVNKILKMEHFNPKTMIIARHAYPNGQLDYWAVHVPQHRSTIGTILSGSLSEDAWLEELSIPFDTMRSFYGLRDMGIGLELALDKKYHSCRDNALASASGLSKLTAADHVTKEQVACDHELDISDVSSIIVPFSARMSNKNNTVESQWEAFDNPKDLVCMTVGRYHYLHDLSEVIRSNTYSIEEDSSVGEREYRLFIKDMLGNYIHEFNASVEAGWMGENPVEVGYMENLEDMDGLSSFLQEKDIIKDVQQFGGATVLTQQGMFSLRKSIEESQSPALIKNDDRLITFKLNALRMCCEHNGNPVTNQAVLDVFIDAAEDFNAGSLLFDNKSSQSLCFESGLPAPAGEMNNKSLIGMR